jgi:hypothetical protein
MMSPVGTGDSPCGGSYRGATTTTDCTSNNRTPQRRPMTEECLSLAEAFGWERARTVAPATCHQGDCHYRWDGNYRTNDYQQVTDDDARAFAAGLKRAIDAVALGNATRI